MQSESHQGSSNKLVPDFKEGIENPLRREITRVRDSRDDSWGNARLTQAQGDKNSNVPDLESKRSEAGSKIRRSHRVHSDKHAI
ncbi:hypothetical protein Bca101_014094 [Brassica carinata]